VTAPAPTSPRLLRIQDVAAEVGLTPRTIRYYEELGLLRPAARSEGAYRLYDADDLARLTFIKGLRDDAGFSLAEVGQLLEDEEARARNRERFRETESTEERRRIIDDAMDRVDRQMASLRRKIHRLEEMIHDADERRTRLLARRAALDADSVADQALVPKADPDAVGEPRPRSE
jgi:DNA-binding transcriptional MerR regulator